MFGRDGDSYPTGSLGDRWRTNGRGKHSRLEEVARQGQCLVGLPDEHGDDGADRLRETEAQPLQLSVEAMPVGPETCPTLRLSLDDFQGPQGGGGSGGGRGGGIHEGSGRVHQKLDQGVRSDDIGSACPKGFAQGAHVKGEPTFDLKKFQRSPAVSAHDAGPVGVIDEHLGLVAFRHVKEIGKGCDVSVHAEDPLGHDQRGAARPPACQEAAKVVEVVVPKDAQICAAQSAAVDQAGMAKPVRHDQASRLGEGWDQAQIRQIARAEQERRFGSLELRQALLKGTVRSQIP